MLKPSLPKLVLQLTLVSKKRIIEIIRKLPIIISIFFTAVSTFLIALSQFLATFVAVLVVDKFGRRLLLIVSDLFMALALFALGVYFYMDENIDPNCNNATRTILIEVIFPIS